ncbi:hypothetical protein F511_41392 [Dorcoceras hygrometricum]|uniref:Uncharacterized protein n=1 Tax=Dorcoceras hygrometricum TaxID=472368 RepID=A0A2Z7C8H8_9LAMI|nr:hypothetical protein F511_41392 [Dorcoceras hygrometricum]
MCCDWYCSPADVFHFISADVCLRYYEIVTTQILLAEPLGSLAFKMVQVRQLTEEQQVELESADGWRCVYPRPTFSVS